jgi:hypothetical protein
MNRLRTIASSSLLHPLLFATYPIVFLWSQNKDDGAPIRSAFEILVITLAIALVIYAICRRLLHNAARAGVATSAIIVLALTFGHVEQYMNIGAGMATEDGLLAAWVLFFFAGVLIARGLKTPERATRPLNFIAAFLVAINLAPVGTALAHTGPVPTVRGEAAYGNLDAHAHGPARDVYYLIFDRYAGERTLSDLYGYDNAPFLQTLRDRGFQVVDNALANYPQTTHSLASSLNMVYLDDLAEQVGTDSSNREPLYESFSDPAVAQAFASMGYTYEHIGSWWAVTWVDPAADHNYIYGGVPEFSQVFLDTTILPVLAQKLGISSIQFERQAYDRIGFQIDSLEDVSENPDPTFTFAHILLPHPPYVFDAEGNFIPPGSDRPDEEAYVEQLRHCNDVILQIVDMLRDAPGPEPIIVVQSDEGPHPPEQDGITVMKAGWADASDVELGRKLRIINAYYLPHDDDHIAEDMTPVNTFRVILDDYFGGQLPLLPNRTYIYTEYNRPYEFVDVTDRLRP